MLPSLVLGHVVYAEGLVAILTFLVAWQFPAALGALGHARRLWKFGVFVLV